MFHRIKSILNFLVLFRFVVFASNTKDSLSLLGRHFPNPNLKIANYPLIPTARVRLMISITPKKACEGTCIFESTFKQSIKEKRNSFKYEPSCINHRLDKKAIWLRYKTMCCIKIPTGNTVAPKQLFILFHSCLL